MFNLKSVLFIGVTWLMVGEFAIAAQRVEPQSRLITHEEAKEIADKYNLKIVPDRDYFYVKFNLAADNVVSAKTISFFYLNYVSSNFICRAGSEVFGVKPNEGGMRAPFVGGDYVLVSDGGVDTKTCREKPIDDYFEIDGEFSDGILIAAREFLKNLSVKEKRKYSRLDRLALERTTNNSIVFEAEYIHDDDESEGLSIVFDLINGKFGLLDKNTYIFEF